MDTHTYFDISAQQVVASHERYENMDSDGFSLHTHDCCELIFLKGGSLSYLAEGRRYTVEPGSFILTRPGIRHTIRFRDPKLYDRYLFLLDKDFFDDLPEELEVIHPGNGAVVEDLFRKMDFYANYLESDRLEQILLGLIREAVLNLQLFSARQPENFTANPIVAQAVSYITDHLQEDISVESLCFYLHITKSYLHRLFLTYLQVPPAKYITAKRLDRARTDIRAGLKPAQSYSLWGFRDYCTFYRNYVRHFGYPPSKETDQPAPKMIEWQVYKKQ